MYTLELTAINKILINKGFINIVINDLDMFDENLLKVKEYEKTQDLIKENIRDLSNTYGKLKIASILVKILQLRAWQKNYVDVNY